MWLSIEWKGFEFYFELSNEERLKLLFNLREKNMNITALPQKINTTRKKRSRHVSRLTEFNLTQR